MRTLLPILTLSLLVFGCQKQSQAPLVVEDVTRIVGAGRTTEALGIETLDANFFVAYPLCLLCIFVAIAAASVSILRNPRNNLPDFLTELIE